MPRIIVRPALFPSKVDRFVPCTQHVNLEIVRHTTDPHNRPTRIGRRRGRCRGTSLIRKRRPLGPCSSPLSRALWWSYGVGVSVWARYPCMAVTLGKRRGWASAGVKLRVNLEWGSFALFWSEARAWASSAFVRIRELARPVVSVVLHMT